MCNAIARLLMVVAVLSVIGGCRKSAPAYKEKTQQERHDSYHRDLTTADLQLFSLRGAVCEAEMASLAGAPGALLLRFLPNGILESAVMGADSLTIVRNNEGNILHLQTSDGQDLLPAIRKSRDDGTCHPTNIVYY